MNCFLSWNLKDMTNISAEKLQKNISQQKSYIELYKSELLKEALRFNVASLLRNVCMNRRSFGTDEFSEKATDCLIVFLHALSFQKAAYFTPTDVENPAVPKGCRNLHRLMLENLKTTMKYIDYGVLLKHAYGEIDVPEMYSLRRSIYESVFPNDETIDVCNQETINDDFYRIVDQETTKARCFMDFDVRRCTGFASEFCDLFARTPRQEDEYPASEYGVIGASVAYLETPFIKYGNSFYSFVTNYSLPKVKMILAGYELPETEQPTEEEEPVEESVQEPAPVVETVPVAETDPISEPISDEAEPTVATEPIVETTPVAETEPASEPLEEEPAIVAPIIAEPVAEAVVEEPEMEEPETAEPVLVQPAVEEPIQDEPDEIAQPETDINEPEAVEEAEVPEKPESVSEPAPEPIPASEEEIFEEDEDDEIEMQEEPEQPSEEEVTEEELVPFDDDEDDYEEAETEAEAEPEAAEPTEESMPEEEDDEPEPVEEPVVIEEPAAFEEPVSAEEPETTEEPESAEEPQPAEEEFEEESDEDDEFEEEEQIEEPVVAQPAEEKVIDLTQVESRMTDLYDEDDFEEIYEEDKPDEDDESAYYETDEYEYPDEYEEDFSNSMDSENQYEGTEVFEIAEDELEEEESFGDRIEAEEEKQEKASDEKYNALVSPDTYGYLDETDPDEFEVDPMLEEQEAYEDIQDEDEYEEPEQEPEPEEEDPYAAESLFSFVDDDDEETPEEPAQPVEEAVEKPFPQPEPETEINEPTPEPVAEPTPEPTPEPAPEPVVVEQPAAIEQPTVTEQPAPAEPEVVPTSEPTPQPVVEPAPQPAEEPAEEPIPQSEPAPEPEQPKEEEPQQTTEPEAKQEEPETEIEEPTPEPVAEPEPVPEPEPEPESDTLPLLEHILTFSPSKNNPITQYIQSCQMQQQKELVKVIELARKSWIIDGKDKMFTIPDTEISIAIFSETQDPMVKIQRKENIGAVMYSRKKDAWNSLELSFDPAGQMVKALYNRISRSSFSEWEWRIVEKLGTRLLERISK